MSLISAVGKNLLTNGAKFRTVLRGKQLEALPVQLRPLIENIEKPVVHLGINGRGAEGSMYGIKVFAKGNKKPVAAAAGRIDYRGSEPVLQARGFVKKNTGAGDALRANVQMDTSRAIDLENMDELILAQKKGIISVSAKSDALNADIVLDKAAAEEILNFAGAGPNSKLQYGRDVLKNGFENIRKSCASAMERINPFKSPAKAAEKSQVAKAAAEKVETKAGTAISDIEKYLAGNDKAIKSAEKERRLKDVDWMKNELKNLSDNFAKASTEAERNSIASSYKELQEKISSNLKYIRDCLD